MRGFVVAGTRTLMTLRVSLNFEQSMCMASSSSVQIERNPGEPGETVPLSAIPRGLPVDVGYVVD